ncbi:relaxin-3-like [Stigmatopora argus]
MLWSPTAYVLALALVACGGAQGEAGGKVVRSRDYGVKLCGREFIRAVIFTCGGSRWKRVAVTPHDSFDWSPHRDEQPAIIHTRNFFERRRSVALSSNSDAQVLTVRARQSERNEPGRLDVLGALAQLQRGIGARGRRYFSGGVASVCCTQGCTRNDIGRLC